MSAKSRMIVGGALSAALFCAPTISSAASLPAFSTDIVPVTLKVTIVSQKVTTRAGTTESDTFSIKTAFNSTDFTEDLINLSGVGGTFQVGVAPNSKCRTGDTILTPISIPMADVSHTSSMGDDIFTLMDDPTLSANWTISPFEGSSSAGGQSTSIISCNNGVCTESSSGGVGDNSGVSCINGVCTQSGSGGSVIINNNGSVITQNNSGGGSGGTPPSDQMTFQASSTKPGVIPQPQTPVAVFFLYPGDNDADDPSGGLEGGCIVLHSTSINNQTRSINGKTTVTRTFVAN
jgi:hypothetical protein